MIRRCTERADCLCTIRGCCLFALAGATLALAAPMTRAAGGEVARDVELLAPSAETGKPALTLPAHPLTAAPDGCLPALPCGTRLLGEVRKNGAVELQVPALRW